MRKAEHFVGVIRNQTALAEFGCLTEDDDLKTMNAILNILHDLRISLSYRLCLSGLRMEEESQHATRTYSLINISRVTYSIIIKQVLRYFRMLQRDLKHY